jgi:hypothetical protein
VSRTQILADVAVAMGGRAAEEIIFGPAMVTTGTTDRPSFILSFSLSFSLSSYLKVCTSQLLTALTHNMQRTSPCLSATGASSDFKQAARLANMMVAQMGMSDKVRPAAALDNLSIINKNDDDEIMANANANALTLCWSCVPGVCDQVGPVYRGEKDLERASSETRHKIEGEVEALLQVGPPPHHHHHHPHHRLHM